MNRNHRKPSRALLRGLPAGLVLALCAPLTGCGPTVFSGNAGLSIIGELPPLPPPPPPPPPAEPKRVELAKDKIIIRDKVFFAFNRASVLSESHSLLQEVAKVMKENPHVKNVRVDGHASLENDNVSSRSYNKQLSGRRSQAVLEYLVLQGVERDRLEARGFGNEVPLESNDTDTGREKNRRVEFTITEQDAK